MRISFCCTNIKAQPWLEGLRAALPGAEVSAWTPGAQVADYALVWSPPQQFFDEQTRLKGVFNIGAGVDALLKLSLPKGVPLVRLDDAGMAVQMAEYVCHAVIRHFREFDHYEADAKDGKWSFHRPQLRADFPVGVMGLGALGARVCRALTQFEFPVLGWSRTAKNIEGVQCFSGKAAFDSFLAATRILVCLLPLTPETENIMRRETLAKLLPRAYVINVARGRHLVEEDLIALIGSGHIAGATLDVFRTEPLPAAHAFWAYPGITITPHISGGTLRDESLAQIAEKIKALQAGAPIASLAGVVDLSRGY